MKIVLVRPNVNIRWMITPPIGMGYVIAAMKRAGHEAIINDSWMRDESPARATMNMLGNAPDIIGIQLFSDGVPWAREFIKIVRQHTSARIIVGGPYVTAVGDQARIETGADTAVVGEFETDIDEHLHMILSGETLIKRAEWVDVNTNPIPDWDSMLLPKYWPYLFNASVPVRGKRVGVIQRTRGCPYHCLDGETIINTIDGNIRIKDLVGKKTKVLTRSKEGKIIYADAIRISKIGENDRLVRIYFDNGETLDCTPDHLLKKFKNSNQHTEVREYDVRADSLAPGDSVVSVHHYIGPYGYVYINYGCRQSVFKHRLVMESVIGRKIERKEQIHHLDRNKENNSIDNLFLCPSVSAHFALHPEIAQRMRKHNPTVNMNDEWRKKIGIGCTGKIRTPEQREHYRQSKLGNKNPHHRDYKPYVNHRVSKVEYLDVQKDTYCMEVPGYDWFFANNILVHNCTFCSGGTNMGHKVRFRDTDNVIEEIKYLQKRWNIDEVWFQDDNAIVNYMRGIELFNKLAPLKLHIRFPSGIRWENVTNEMVRMMKQAGVYFTGIGIESGNPRVLKRIKKQLDQEWTRDAIKILAHHGILTIGFFIIGLPTETREEMEDTVRWAMNTRLHHAQFGRFIPYPGSEDYSEHSLLTNNELIKVQRNATLRFYLRPRIIWNFMRYIKLSQINAIFNHPWVKTWTWRENKNNLNKKLNAWLLYIIFYLIFGSIVFISLFFVKLQ